MITEETRAEVMERDETCVITQWVQGQEEQDGVPEDFPRPDLSNPLHTKIDIHHGIKRDINDPTLDEAWNLHAICHFYHIDVLHGHPKYGDQLKRMIREVSIVRRPANVARRKQAAKNERTRQKDQDHKRAVANKGKPKKKKLKKFYGLAGKPWTPKKKAPAAGSTAARKLASKKSKAVIDAAAYHGPK